MIRNIKYNGIGYLNQIQQIWECIDLPIWYIRATLLINQTHQLSGQIIDYIDVLVRSYVIESE